MTQADCGCFQARVSMDLKSSLLLTSEARTKEKLILGPGPSRWIPLGKPLVLVWLSPFCILIEVRARVGKPAQQNCTSRESIHLS